MTTDVDDLNAGLEATSQNAQLLGDDLDLLAREFDKLGAEGKSFASSFERELTSAMKSVIVDGKSLSSALRDIALAMGDKAFDQAMSTGLSAVAEGVMSSLGFAKGGVLMNGEVQAFANGGVVGGPTNFIHSGGVGLMGEAGAEAILPLSRNEDGKLGVKSHATKNIHVNFNVQTPDVRSFQKSRAQLATELYRTIQSANR